MSAARIADAQRVVRRYARYSMIAGAIPLPYADLAVATGVQVKLVAELSKLYGIPFSKDRAKILISSLLGGAAASAVGAGALAAAGSVVKTVPGVGTLAGIVTVGAFAHAFTKALGAVFIQHYESGGTFLNFDPEQVREHFKAEFARASHEESEEAVA